MEIKTIGRDLQNDIVINDCIVSRHHCQIIRDDSGRFQVVDLNSKNGTYVNGHRISGNVILSDKDVLRVGNTVLPWKSYFYCKPPEVSSHGTTLNPSPGYQSPVIISPSPVIPENININKKIETSNVLRKGDDFKVKFNRNMGDKMGDMIGSTMGCLGSIVLIIIFIVILGCMIKACA